jgi:hypothetical protein
MPVMSLSSITSLPPGVIRRLIGRDIFLVSMYMEVEAIVSVS